MNKVKNLMQQRAKEAKRLFDFCDKKGEGIHGHLHLLESGGDMRDAKVTYRGYHANGYCFDVSREPYEHEENCINDSAINGFEYSYNDEMFDGFKTEPNAEKLISLIK